MTQDTNDPLPKLQVLVIEDCDEDVVLLTRVFRKLPFDVRYERVDTTESLTAALDRGPWDIVLSDYAMPRFDGLSALKMIRGRHLDMPFILVTGTIGEDKAVEIMKAGANDYVLKGNLTRLGPAIERELRDAASRRENARAQEALREIDERNRAIVTTAADGIMTFDAQGVVESFNPAAERIFGYSAADVIGTSLARLLRPVASTASAVAAVDGLPELTPGCQESPAGAGGPNAPRSDTVTEALGLRQDGTSFPVEFSVSKHRFGERGLFTGIVHDTTERVRAQEHIRTQFERMSALRAIDVAITGSFDLRVTLNIVLDQVTTLLGTDAADVLLIDRATGVLNCASSRGFRTPAIRQMRLRIGEGLPGRALRTRAMVEVAQLSGCAEETRTALITEEQFAAYKSVPLVAKGNLTGVLEVFHRSALERDGDWLSFLETLAGQAAIAIDSITMFEELQRSNTDLLDSYDATIEGWSRALDLRDHETEGHAQRVADLTVSLARRMGLNEAEIADARRGALLHDVGKIGVPDSVLLKPGPLTHEEREQMKQHPDYAYDWLSRISFLRGALDIPYCHHEKWDGTGYPRGLAGEAIPRSARLFAIIDVWDALTSDRPYREAWPREKVLAHLQELSSTHFDPAVVKAFTAMIAQERSEARPNGGALTEWRATTEDEGDLRDAA